MERARLLCLVVALVGVASAFAATNAWARPNPMFLFEGTGLPPLTVSIKTPSGAAHTLFYYHGSSQPLVECELARGTGEILNVSETAWLKAAAVTYEECKVTNYETTCAINGSMLHGSLKLSGLEGEVGYYEPASSKVLFHMKSASGTFAEMDFTGTRCPLTGVNNLKKGVIGEIPSLYCRHDGDQIQGDIRRERLARTAIQRNRRQPHDDRRRTETWHDPCRDQGRTRIHRAERRMDIDRHVTYAS